MSRPENSCQIQHTSGPLKTKLRSRISHVNYATLSLQMVNMNDRFGQVMLENMATRGCGMPGLAACVDRAAQASLSLVAQGLLFIISC